MGRHDISQSPSRSWFLLPLLLSLWTATASALSLSDFGLITSSQVSTNCLLVYNSQISGCSTSDFTRGNSCSLECLRGLQRLETRLLSVCGGAKVSELSVLGQVLLGNLLPLLCPRGNSGKPTSTRVIVTATSATLITSTVRTVPTSSRLSLTLTTVRPPLTTTTATASAVESSTTTTSEAPEEEITTSSTSLTDIPTFVQSATSTITTSSQTSSTAPAQQTTRAVRGGGSPFDFAVQSSGAIRRGIIGGSWMMGAVVMGIMMMLLA